jgi:hypothetical protein
VTAPRAAAARALAFALALWACAACDGAADGGDAGSAGGDGGSGDAASPAFAVVFEQLDAALISVGGTSSRDVWAVGADLRDGSGALVLRFDGERWTRAMTGVEQDLWWVFVQDAQSVYMGGTGGAIVHWDGERFARMDTPGTGTVFGIWGAAQDELWAVGGEPDIAPGFVWRYDGQAWTDMTAMLPAPAREPTLFKVWGRSRDDVWFVGSSGLAVHWDGAALSLGESATGRRLFTVHGSPSGDPPFVAVGGFGDAVIVEHDGTQWHTVTPAPAPPELFGVFMVSDGEGYAVGAEGTVVQRVGAAWKLLDTKLDLLDALHAVWVDPEGGVWAVGGNLLTATPDQGMLVHSGEVISNEISE